MKPIANQKAPTGVFAAASIAGTAPPVPQSPLLIHIAVVEWVIPKQPARPRRHSPVAVTANLK